MNNRQSDAEFDFLVDEILSEFRETPQDEYRPRVNAAVGSSIGQHSGPRHVKDSAPSRSHHHPTKERRSPSRKCKSRRAKSGQVVLSMIIVVCLIGLGIIVPKVYGIISDYIEARKEYAEIVESAVFVPPEDSAPTEEEVRQYFSMSLADLSEDEIDQMVKDYITSWIPIEVDWDYLRSVNSDIVGWIYCPGTMINYPVVQTKNNDYYLSHSFYGEYSGGGAIYANYQSSIGNTLSNLTLYGHHMRDNSMFGSLKYYKDRNYYESHPTMYFLTPSQNYRVDLICAHIFDAGTDTIPVLFRDERDYQAYLDEMLKISSWSCQSAISTGRQLLTLVTCDYSSGYVDPRYIVQGSMTPIGTATNIEMYLYKAETTPIFNTTD